MKMNKKLQLKAYKLLINLADFCKNSLVPYLRFTRIKKISLLQILNLLLIGAIGKRKKYFCCLSSNFKLLTSRKIKILIMKLS